MCIRFRGLKNRSQILCVELGIISCTQDGRCWQSFGLFFCFTRFMRKQSSLSLISRDKFAHLDQAGGGALTFQSTSEPTDWRFKDLSLLSKGWSSHLSPSSKLEKAVSSILLTYHAALGRFSHQGGWRMRIKSLSRAYIYLFKYILSLSALQNPVDNGYTIMLRSVCQSRASVCHGRPAFWLDYTVLSTYNQSILFQSRGTFSVPFQYHQRWRSVIFRHSSCQWTWE